VSGAALKSRLSHHVATYDAARERAIRFERMKEFALKLAAHREVTSNTNDPSTFAIQHIYLPTSNSTSNTASASDYTIRADAGISPYAFQIVFNTLKSGAYVYSSPAQYVVDLGPSASWNAGVGVAEPVALIVHSGVAQWPSAIPTVSVELERLATAVYKIFPKATITQSIQTDNEEGWSRPLLTVETGIEDPQRLSELEYKFYEEVESHESLTAALNEITVLFL
jgi:hypothetical protein